MPGEGGGSNSTWSRAKHSIKQDHNAGHHDPEAELSDYAFCNMMFQRYVGVASPDSEAIIRLRSASLFLRSK